LNVTYARDRGEPRGSLKSNRKLKADGKPAGDCIDCGQCVVVCPTGTDIRLGSQLSCIQCGLCIDACDSVMDKIGAPRGLIGYDTDINIERRKAGKEPFVKLVRARTLIYAVLISSIALFMVFVLLTRNFADVNVLHDRNPIFVVNSDGSVRNGYTVRLLNKRTHERTFVLGVEGLPPGIRIEAVGITDAVDGKPLVHVGPDQTREIRVSIVVPKGAAIEKSTPVTFRITDTTIGENGTAKDFFKAP
jgi:cytochrome c oxidase accessory protein FixG